MARRLSGYGALVFLALVLSLFALARPVDHDESQYVAAAMLTAHGLLPYRDFAYLQTPLQPFVFAPLTLIAGSLAWQALRIVNAMFGVIIVGCTWRAARIGGASRNAALAAAATLAACDVFLFSVGTARNDALPAALLAAALVPVVSGIRNDATRSSALLAGFLLAAAAAAKVSYALPAAAYGIHSLFDRRQRPAWVAAGAVLPIAFTLVCAWANPPGFMFGVFDFPANAPAQYYTAADRPWKLSYLAKAIDFVKFLALGPALAAFLLATRFRWKGGRGKVIDWMLAAAVVAALLPMPTWRQYLLPILPMLFVRLAIGWTVRPSGRRGWVTITTFAAIGLTPTILALSSGAPAMGAAMREGWAIDAVLDRAGVGDGVATLSPQFLAAGRRLPDPRFAAGPFYFRSAGLVPLEDEARLRLVSRARLDSLHAVPAIVTGGEGAWTSGDDALDDMLDRWAARAGYRRVDIPGSRFRVWLRPRGGSASASLGVGSNP